MKKKNYFTHSWREVEPLTSWVAWADNSFLKELSSCAGHQGRSGLLTLFSVDLLLVHFSTNQPAKYRALSNPSNCKINIQNLLHEPIVIQSSWPSLCPCPMVLPSYYPFTHIIRGGFFFGGGWWDYLQPSWKNLKLLCYQASILKNFQISDH